MSDGDDVQAVRLPREATGKLLGRTVPEAAARQRLEPGHGTWYYQLELPPRADGTRRPACASGGFATKTDAKAELDRPGSCWPSPPPGDPTRPSGSPTPSPRRSRATRALPDPARVRKAVGGGDDPAVKPPAVGGVARGMAGRQEGAAARHRAQLRRAHPPVPQAATSGTSPSTGSGSPTSRPVRPHRGTQRRDHRGPRQRQPRPAGSRQGPPAGRPGHLPADPRHPPVGDQHLHAAASRGRCPPTSPRWPSCPPGTRPKAPGLDRRAGPRLAGDFDAAARRRPRGRRPGQPRRHLGLHPAPVAGHGLDPRPDHGLPRRRPPAPAARAVAADRHPGAAPGRGLRAAPPRHRPRRRRHHHPLADHPARLGRRPGRPQVRRRRAHRRPRRRHRHRHDPPGARNTTRRREAAGDAWADSGFEFTDELGNPLHPAAVTGHVPADRLPRRAAARSGCTTCATAPRPCCWPPGTT